MSDEEPLDLIPLIFGWNARDLWPLNNFVLPAWLLLALFPRWKWTPTLTIIPPLIHAVVYMLSFITLIRKSSDDDQADLFTLDGVVKAFSNPNGVFVGWVHYVVFDLLVGRGISMDAVSRGATPTFYVLAIVPCLCLTLAAGPIGFLLYAIVRTLALPEPKQKTT